MGVTGEPVDIARQLIRFDTTNPPGNEADCVGYIADLLAAAGLETRLLARDRSRPNLIARLPGRGEAPPLLLHGHVDVVSAHGQPWSLPPFSGALHEGCVWGRGALDMKGGVAMMTTVAMRAAARGELAGDLLLTILSDEEEGSAYGARFLVDDHPELFEGVRYALGEGGGFVLEVSGVRFYPVKVTEKQYCRLEATVRGPGGHGALPVRGGAMGRAGRMLATLDEAKLPVHITPVAREMLDVLGRHTGIGDELAGAGDIDAALDRLGPPADLFEAVVRNTANPTIVNGGAAFNVVPDTVTVGIDARVVPGMTPDDLIDEVRELLGDGEIELRFHSVEPPSPETPDTTLLEPLFDAIREADPAGVPMPMLDAGVTDARIFAQLGIQTYGFLPMPTPPGFDRGRLVHGTDERIPVQTLLEGTDVLDRVLPSLFEASSRRPRERAPD